MQRVVARIALRPSAPLVIRRKSTSDRRVFLRQHFRVRHLVPGFWFQHVDAGLGIGDEIRDVLLGIHASLIENLVLPLCQLKSLLGLTVENLQGPPLRGPGAQPSGDGVDVTVHRTLEVVLSMGFLQGVASLD